MTPKIYSWFLCLIFLASCNSSETENQNPTVDTTTHTIKLTDSSRAKLENALGDIIKSNASPGDTTISGRYVNQGKYNSGDFYITIKTKDSTMALINLSQLKDDDIAKLKKDGDNITVTYNQSDKTVKFLAADYEQEK
jgi:hypothetical protein